MYYFCCIVSQSVKMNPLRVKGLESCRRVRCIFLSSPFPVPPSSSFSNGTFVSCVKSYANPMNGQMKTNQLNPCPCRQWGWAQSTNLSPSSPPEFLLHPPPHHHPGSWASVSEIWSLKVIFTTSFEVLRLLCFISQ